MAEFVAPSVRDLYGQPERRRYTRICPYHGGTTSRARAISHRAVERGGPRKRDAMGVKHFAEGGNQQRHARAATAEAPARALAASAVESSGRLLLSRRFHHLDE